MVTADTPKEEMLAEMENLRIRLEEAEETLRAIGSGEVDAFVVSGPEGSQVFTLKGAEQPYRVLVETMNEGAATLTPDGTILYCNGRLAAMLQTPLEKLLGTQFGSYVTPTDHPLFLARLGKCSEECDKDEITMITGAGNPVPVLISCCALDLSEKRQISLVVTDLSQQKRNEEIVASERLARSIIEQAGEAVIVCDEGGTILRASRLAHDLCGQNLLLKTFNELFNLRIIGTECLFSVSTPLHGGCLESVEVEFNRSDGEIFHLLLNATPLKSEQNGIIGCVVTLTDFSERKKVEEELRWSEERLQVANDQLQEINKTLNEQSAELQSAYHQLQVINEELQVQSEELQAQSEELQTQSEELQAQSEELQTQNRELERLWEESRRAEEALRASDREYAAMFESSIVGKAQADPVTGRFTRVNRTLTEMTGYSAEELCRMTFLEITHPDDRQRDMQGFAPVRAGIANSWQIEKRYVRKDGSIIWVEVAGNLIRDAVGHPTRTSAVIQDITTRKQAEEALQKLNEELENRVAERTAELREKDQILLLQSRLAAMGEMIGNIAHQWRQPLNALGLIVQQIVLFHDLGELNRDVLNKNASQSMELIKHMSRTIDDFRNYFSPDKEKAEFNVKEAIENSLSLMEGSFKDQNISIEVVPKDDPAIIGFRNEFAQVLLNILNNARDALKEREIEDPRVTITLCKEGDRAVVTVADNAGGIPEEIMDRIFAPYFTTKGPQEGTGIGLFMSKSIIEKNMGGSLTVRNIADGAEFRVEL